MRKSCPTRSSALISIRSCSAVCVSGRWRESTWASGKREANARGSDRAGGFLAPREGKNPPERLPSPASAEELELANVERIDHCPQKLELALGRQGRFFDRR